MFNFLVTAAFWCALKYYMSLDCQPSFRPHTPVFLKCVTEVDSIPAFLSLHLYIFKLFFLCFRTVNGNKIAIVIVNEKNLNRKNVLQVCQFCANYCKTLLPLYDASSYSGVDSKLIYLTFIRLRGDSG